MIPSIIKKLREIGGFSAYLFFICNNLFLNVLNVLIPFEILISLSIFAFVLSAIALFKYEALLQ